MKKGGKVTLLEEQGGGGVLKEVLTVFEEEEKVVDGGHAGVQLSPLKQLLCSLRLAGLLEECEPGMTVGTSDV